MAGECLLRFEVTGESNEPVLAGGTATLYVKVVNGAASQVSCSGIQVKVPVGEGAEELAASLKNLSVMVPSKLWREEKRVEENGWCTFSFKPSVVQSLASGRSLTFKLVDVKANAKPGRVKIKCAEQLGVNQAWCEKEEELNKMPVGFVCKEFCAADAAIQHGETTTLTWITENVDTLDIYTNAGQMHYPRESTDRQMTTPPLTTTAGFVLQAGAFTEDRQQSPLYHRMQTTVDVIGQDLTVGDITVAGDLKTNSAFTDLSLTVSMGQKASIPKDDTCDRTCILGLTSVKTTADIGTMKTLSVEAILTDGSSRDRVATLLLDRSNSPIMLRLPPGSGIDLTPAQSWKDWQAYNPEKIEVACTAALIVPHI